MDNTSKRLMRNFAERLDKNKSLKILDLGSLNVNGSYKSIFDNWEYIGIDIIKGRNVDIVLKEHYNWSEIEDESIDVLISGQTFEHIEYPWLTIKEVARVMKSGAIGCLIAPSTGYEHRYPLDCWRIMPDGFRALARWAELEVIDSFIGDKDNMWKPTVLIFKKK